MVENTVEIGVLARVEDTVAMAVRITRLLVRGRGILLLGFEHQVGAHPPVIEPEVAEVDLRGRGLLEGRTPFEGQGEIPPPQIQGDRLAILLGFGIQVDHQDRVVSHCSQIQLLGESRCDWREGPEPVQGIDIVPDDLLQVGRRGHAHIDPTAGNRVTVIHGGQIIGKGNVRDRIGDRVKDDHRPTAGLGSPQTLGLLSSIRACRN